MFISDVLYYRTGEKGEHKIPGQFCKQDRWEPPPINMYKINIDGSFNKDTGKAGWGFLARDSRGQFLEGGCSNLIRVAGPLQAEALAALHSLERVYQLGMARIILETDTTDLVKGLTSEDLDMSVDGGLFIQIREIINNYFDHCEIRHCPRGCNKVADRLATHGASMVGSGSTVFMSQVPSFVTSLVSGDLPGAGI